MPTRVKGDNADAIEARLAEHRGEMERLIQELKTADAGEKQELRDKIEALETHIATEKKAKEQKEKDEGTGGTLVLPPERVPQGQNHGDHKPGEEPTPHQQAPEGGKRKGGWKGAW